LEAKFGAWPRTGAYLGWHSAYSLLRTALLLVLFLSATLCLPGKVLCFRTGEWAYVRYVIDGDTIVLNDGRKVRYVGINAPEIPHKESPGEPFGRKATEFNRKLVLGKKVHIVPAGDRIDRFGRILAFVYLPDGRLVNEKLLKAGLAHVCFFSKDLKHKNLLLQAQLFAINAHRGIWSLKPVNPEPYYIGNSKSLRFHRPWCKYGKRTAKKNRVIFKDRITAFKKGYCRCKKCLP